MTAKGDGAFTEFAPTDDAFAKLPAIMAGKGGIHAIDKVITPEE